MEVGSGKTVYVAGGAVVRGVIGADEPFRMSSYSGLKTYSPTFVLRGKGITFRGRGIVDGSRSTTHARNLVVVQGADVRIEGVILRDSSTWNLPIRQSDRVTVENVKILGYRANSDGIDICNSRDVTVQKCFIRTLDDLIVVKTDSSQGEARHIVARDCVLWNEVAHALSLGAELRQNVDDVLFSNCDVIHDKGREWTLRVYHTDSARISNVRFSDIRIEESPRLMSLWINKAYWSRDTERGHIDGVIFSNITAAANPLRIEFMGFDASHLVENVTLRHVIVNRRAVTAADVKTNEFVRNVTIEPEGSPCAEDRLADPHWLRRFQSAHRKGPVRCGNGEGMEEPALTNGQRMSTPVTVSSQPKSLTDTRGEHWNEDSSHGPLGHRALASDTLVGGSGQRTKPTSHPSSSTCGKALSHGK
jgi:hypothetical protein